MKKRCEATLTGFSARGVRRAQWKALGLTDETGEAENRGRQQLLRAGHCFSHLEHCQGFKEAVREAGGCR